MSLDYAALKFLHLRPPICLCFNKAHSRQVVAPKRAIETLLVCTSGPELHSTLSRHMFGCTDMCNSYKAVLESIRQNAVLILLAYSHLHLVVLCRVANNGKWKKPTQNPEDIKGCFIGRPLGTPLERVKNLAVHFGQNNPKYLYNIILMVLQDCER